MATAPLSLFNTPQQYQQQQWAQAQEQAKALADMSASQRATYGAAMGGTMLGNALPGLLGVEDPELVKIKDIQGMFRGVDRNDYKSLESFAKALADKGYAAEAEQAWQKAQEMKKQSLEEGKLSAEADYYKARAAAASQQKQSTSDIAARRQLISKVEKRIADGENIPDNDPELIQARAALAVETKPQTTTDVDGRIIQVPGIIGSEYAPLVSKRLGGVINTESDPFNMKGTKGLDVSKLSPEQIKMLMSSEGGAEAFANGVKRAGMFKEGQTTSAAPNTPTVIQTPTSIRREEERTTELNKQAEAIDKNITANNNTLASVDRALSKISKWSTGAAALSKNAGFLPAGRLKTEIDQIRAHLTVETMNEMKNQSKTGATGFGAMAVRELEVVQDAMIALRQDNLGPDVAEQLNRVKEHLALYNQYMADHKKKLAEKGAVSSVGSDAEALIQRNMAKNPGRSRAEIIDALRKAGKL